MAVHFNCTCPERKKPVKDRRWMVTQYRWNTGQFEPAGGSPSKYSQVECLICGKTGRSCADYVEYLPMHLTFEKACKVRGQFADQQAEYLRKLNTQEK